MRKKHFNKTLFKALLSFLLILSMTLPTTTMAFASSLGTSAQSAAVTKNNLTISVSYGFDNRIRIGTPTPFYVEVTNHGKDFEGAVRIVVPGRDYNNMYEKDLSLASGATKKIELTVPIETKLSAVTVQVVNTKGTVMVTDVEAIKTLNAIESIHVGILSDNYTSLSYMSGITLFNSANSPSVDTLIHELNENNFPDNWKSLGLIDVIVITDYSTDKLSETQLRALEGWVRNGGSLIIATGSTANKVFSGLKKTNLLKNVNTSALSSMSVETSYGLATVDPSVMAPIDYTGYDSYDYYWCKESFESDYPMSVVNSITNSILSYVTDAERTPEMWFYAYAEDNDELLSNTFAYSLFGIDMTSNPSEWENNRKDLLMKIYEMYLVYYFEAAYKAAKRDPSSSGWTGTSNYVNADIINLESWFASHGSQNSNVLYGDIKDSKDNYYFAFDYSYGLGSIIPVAVDFTLNPLASYRDRDHVFNMLIKTCLATKLYYMVAGYYQNANNYYYNNSYSAYSDLYDTLSSASAPPVLLFIIVLIAYLVSIFVIFAKLKKKGKPIYFWGAQVISAFVFAFIIFLCGFGSRLHNATIRSIRIIELTDGKGEVNEFTSVIMPSSKKYVLSLNPGHNSDVVNPKYYYYYSTNSPDASSYRIGINQSPDANKIIVNNTKPLDTATLYGLYPDESDHGSLDFSSDNVGAYGTVTNNYDRDLERVFVKYDNYFYLIGDLKKGESYTISSATPSYAYTRGWSTGGVRSDREKVKEYFHNNAFGFTDVLLGTNNDNYRHALYRASIIENVVLGEFFIVGGFTATPEGESLQTNNKYNESSYDYVYVNLQH